MSYPKICAEILRIRTVRKIGVRQMAKEIGISPATLNRIENGKTVSVDVAAKIGPWAGKCACCGQSVGLETMITQEVNLPLAGKDIATLTHAELVTEISRLLTESDRLQRENAAIKIDASNHAADAETVRREREVERRRAMAAESEVMRLREALEPFSQFRTAIMPGRYTDAIGEYFVPSDFEKARAALASTGGDHHAE